MLFTVVLADSEGVGTIKTPPPTQASFKMPPLLGLINELYFSKFHLQNSFHTLCYQIVSYPN